MTHIKEATTEHPVMDEISRRWSPVGFTDKKIEPGTVRSIFEAARWAASAFNEQPWRYIIATKDQPDQFERLLSCLVEGNQAWAKNVFLIGLGLISTRFAHNDKPNRSALHDLGQASASLSVQATHFGLHVHQMGGILPDRARDLYEIPEQFEAVTGIAIGYLAPTETLPEDLKKRDNSPRSRRSIGEFVFGPSWDEAAEILKV